MITSTQLRFSPEQQQGLATSETLKGAEAEAIKQQQKASQIMAERLPGLTDPNALPAAPATATQPGQTSTAATAPPAPKLLTARHPDRFTPGAQTPPVRKTAPAAAGTKPQAPPAQTPEKPAQPRRNPTP